MKSLSIAGAIIATAGVVASAQPHRHHHHQHAQKRAPAPVPDVVYDEVPETVVVCDFMGKLIPYDECQEALNNGTFVTSADGMLQMAQSSSASSSSILPSSTSKASTSIASSSAIISPVVQAKIAVTTSASVALTSTATPTQSTSTLQVTSSAASSAPVHSSSSVAASTSASASASTSASVSNGNGVNSAFPDGQLSCSTFPSAYGAIEVDWVGLGGWTGIQNPRSQVSAGFADIETATSGTCSGGNCCEEGNYCSYACPPGYQKSQWPTTQGATGQSIGGLLCQGGKLHLTNAGLSNNLCIPGAQQVNVMVKNTMNQQTAVCRTDYPGTEGETVPLNAQPGSNQNLTMPASDSYYQWQGRGTSAQYYVNPAGTSVSDGCQWGSSNSNLGNYAPLNLGVGWSSGMAWLSIFQNSPTTDAKLDFTIEIVGNDGGFSNLNGRCKYSNGQYCSGNNYENCSPTTGCTVSTHSESYSDDDRLANTFYPGLCQLWYRHLRLLIESRVDFFPIRSPAYFYYDEQNVPQQSPRPQLSRDTACHHLT